MLLVEDIVRKMRKGLAIKSDKISVKFWRSAKRVGMNYEVTRWAII